MVPVDLNCVALIFKEFQMFIILLADFSVIILTDFIIFLQKNLFRPQKPVYPDKERKDSDKDDPGYGGKIYSHSWANPISANFLIKYWRGYDLKGNGYH